MASQIVQLSTLQADTAMQAETKSLRPESVNTVHDAEAQQPEKGGPPPDPSVPDGGWRAWSVVMGSWFIIFATFGYLNAFGVYQAYYSTHLGKPDSTISWIGSFQLFMQFALGYPAGKLFDEGYCRHLIFGGSIIYSLSLFMLSLTKNQFYQVFLAQGVGAGLGTGLLFLPATSVISHWFARRRSFAIGVVIAGSSVGGVAFPIMLNNLISSIGFASAVRASVYLVLGCLVIANLLVAPRLPPRRLRPAHMQLPPPDMKKILNHRAYQLAIIGGFFCTWGFFMPFFYLQIFAQSKGVDENLAFYLLAILNGASIFGRILPNFVADKIGPYNMIIPFSLATAVMIFGWLGLKNTAGFIVFAILYGFLSGAFISLLPSVFMTLASSMGEMGIRIGIGFFGNAFGALTGTPICGALLGNDLQWWKPTVFAGVTVCTGTVFLAIARHMHARDKGTWRV